MLTYSPGILLGSASSHLDWPAQDDLTTWHHHLTFFILTLEKSLISVRTLCILVHLEAFWHILGEKIAACFSLGKGLVDPNMRLTYAGTLYCMKHKTTLLWTEKAKCWCGYQTWALAHDVPPTSENKPPICIEEPAPLQYQSYIFIFIWPW